MPQFVCLFPGFRKHPACLWEEPELFRETISIGQSLEL